MTDKTELEVTLADREAAADLYMVLDDDVVTPAIIMEAERYRRGEYDSSHPVQAFARHRLATRTPNPTPVALSDEEAFRQMHLLYNYIDDDSIQFTRWQMVIAMAHGMRLAHPPAVPDDGLVEAAQEVIDHTSFNYKARNGRECCIADDSGERCVIIPHESYHRLQSALAAYRGEA